MNHPWPFWKPIVIHAIGLLILLVLADMGVSFHHITIFSTGVSIIVLVIGTGIVRKLFRQLGAKELSSQRIAIPIESIGSFRTEIANSHEAKWVEVFFTTDRKNMFGTIAIVHDSIICAEVALEKRGYRGHGMTAGPIRISIPNDSSAKKREILLKLFGDFVSEVEEEIFVRQIS